MRKGGSEVNRIFKASGIPLWPETVNVTLSGHEAAAGADTFLGAPLRTELPAPCLQREAGPGWWVYRAVPACRAGSTRQLHPSGEQQSVVWSAPAAFGRWIALIHQWAQTREPSVCVVTGFTFISLVLTQNVTVIYKQLKCQHLKQKYFNVFIPK